MKMTALTQARSGRRLVAVNPTRTYQQVPPEDFVPVKAVPSTLVKFGDNDSIIAVAKRAVFPQPEVAEMLTSEMRGALASIWRAIQSRKLSVEYTNGFVSGISVPLTRRENWKIGQSRIMIAAQEAT